MEGNTPRGTLLFRKGEREMKGIILNNNFIIIIIMQILTIAWSKIFAKTSKELTNGTRCDDGAVHAIKIFVDIIDKF